MTAQFARAPYAGRSPVLPNNPPQAALLIDFDNVTMGIRSDITKELKNLLNSDVIKGKVAVQRAYADWRRYPQYIVPLAEASVDLIFAPAYGSSKKNATDIRLAIDALELVFTRSEIGTFILLSGDSDFSSLVLKLKEYGKYVIGVGIRESASDLLVQNCDEYYSYSALTGLTRAGDEAPIARHDPWELVEQAVRQMAANNDVMRSDRLKQVIIEIDPNFDEKQLGFPKFNRFLQEAQNRGVLSLQKMENGQYEVGVPDGTVVAEKRDEERSERGRRGRRRGRDRERREEREAARAALPREEVTAEAAPKPPAEAKPSAEAKPVAEEKPAEVKPPQAKPEPVTAKATEAPVAREERAPAAREERAPVAREDRSPADVPPAELRTAYDLLRRATGDLTRGGGAARDSDVKRRMLELNSEFDESNYGFSKFSRFLRQAHDAEVITLRKLENGNYEVVLGDGADRFEDGARGRRGRDEAPRAERPAREERPPRGEKPAKRDEQAPRAPAARAAELDGATKQVTTPAEPSRTTQAPASPPAAAQPAAAQPAPAETAAATPTPAVPRGPVGLRRGSRGARPLAGPPPLLEGQTVPLPKGTAAAQGATPSQPAPQPKAEAPAAEKAAQEKPAAKPAAEKKPAAKGGERRPRREKAPAPERGGRAAKKAPAKGAAVDFTALGLPTDPKAVVEHIVGYKGVGQKSADQLVEAFGADRLFQALQNEQDRVREILGARRAEALLEAWNDDIAFRRANAAPTKQLELPTGEQGGGNGRGGRTRRGGRRGRRAGSGAGRE